MSKHLSTYINDHLTCIEAISHDQNLLEKLGQCIDVLTDSYKNGNKVLFCGNGGSAADAEHLAGELSGKFKIERSPLFAEALHVNSATLTAVANDYSYAEAFARILESKAKANDVLIAISTSGNSENILKAIEKAKSLDLKVIGMGGSSASIMMEQCDLSLMIPSTDTPRIQEAYMLLGHIICQEVEKNLFAK